VIAASTLNELVTWARRREAGGSLNRLLLGHTDPKNKP
jgi:hypothetical protein